MSCSTCASLPILSPSPSLSSLCYFKTTDIKWLINSDRVKQQWLLAPHNNLALAHFTKLYYNTHEICTRYICSARVIQQQAIGNTNAFHIRTNVSFTYNIESQC
jgi:hypothetical protein